MIIDTVSKIGEKVTIEGWVHSRRDHGKIMFLDLRDRTGLVQVVSVKTLCDVHPEDCVAVTGTVKARPATMVNPKLATGTVEMDVEEIKVYSKAAELPFPLDSDGREISEEIRLKYRYLDLRRERLQHNIKQRSMMVDSMRQYLFRNGFTEIETPMLTKSTPEGSRDFLVPSRLQPGKFYALPQSPQQYKQLLMVAGFERYFQIARCMRDEDLRADRGFEHTQLDLEMSFVKREDVMAMIEGLTIEVIEKLGGTILKKPFPVITYKEAMEKYGADKFDMRTAEEKAAGVHAFAWVVDFPFFEKDKEGQWTYTHNPFSDIREDQKEAFMGGQVEGIMTSQYDLVWNGYEAGGGSIRNTDPTILSKVFEVLGHGKEKIDGQFGHMLKAFSFGVPPHGGIALGIDRWTMCVNGETSIKEVQAFPQTSSGTTSVMDAPANLEPEQLAELGISVLPPKKK
jgi:aspartyl-tRNA synthetase